MITVRVRCAFFTAGLRKALTPLLTASTPVSAAQPLEKALRSSQYLTASVMGGGGGSAATGVGCPWLRRTRRSPAAMVMSSVPTKRYVGTAKTTPASRTPRRLMMVMRIKMPTHIEVVCGSNDGTAETNAPTPAEMPTAAVRM